MMSSKAYRIPTAKDRLLKHQINIKDLEALDRLRDTPRPVAATRGSGSSGAGSTGGGTGNFLSLEGGTMIGNIAFDPKLIAVNNGRVNLDPGSTVPENSSYILVTGQGTPDDIKFIDGAERNGQLLIYQGTNQQIQNLLNANLLTGSAVGDNTTTTIIVTLSDTGSLQNGDTVNIVGGSEFDANDVTISNLVVDVSFEYDLGVVGSTTPATVTVQDGNIVTSDGNTVILDGTTSTTNAPIATFVFDTTIAGGGAWRVMSTSTPGTGVVTTDASAATLAITSAFDPEISGIPFNDNIIFGPGIIDKTSEEAGVFQLTGGIFQLTSSIALDGVGTAFMRSRWRRADNVDFTTGDLLVGTISKIVNSLSVESVSNAPGSAVTIDARTQDVFVRLDIIQDSGNGLLQPVGTWGQIISVGGGNGDGDVTLPIRFPVTTGLPTTGNVTLNLNQTSGHYFTIGPLTGNIDIDIINPPPADTAQAFRINIIKGATDFTVTFNDTLLVQPFIGTENTTTLLAGDIYDGTVFNIFTMTSTAGSGAPVENWAFFPAKDDVDFATFDGINVDRFLFAVDSTSFASATDVGFVRGTTGLLANVQTEQSYFWLANLQSLMTLSQAATSNNTQLDVITTIDGAIPKIRTFALDPTLTAGASISRMEFIALNSVAENIAYAGIQTDLESFENGFEEGSLRLIARNVGSFATFMEMNFEGNSKIKAFRNILMDTGRDIDLNGNKLRMTDSNDVTFIKGDSSSVGIFVTDASTAKGNFGLTKLSLVNDYFLQTQVVEHRPLTADPTTIDGAIWYRSDTDQLLGQLNSGIVDLGAAGSIPSSIVDGNTTATVFDSIPSFVVTLNGITKFTLLNNRIDYAALDVFGITQINMSEDSVPATPTQISSLTASTDGLVLNILSSGDVYDLQIASADAFHVDTLRTRITSTTPSTAGAALSLFRPDPTPQSGDEIGKITFDGRNTKAPQEFTTYATWRTTSFNVGENTETGVMRLDLIASGTKVEVLKIEPDRTQIRNSTTVDTEFVELALLKEDASSSAGDNIAVVGFNVLDNSVETDYARILGKIVNQNDAGSLQFDVRANDVSDVNALTIEGSATISGRTFVTFNPNTRISSDLKFQPVTGSTDFKIFPALNQLGIVVQDNATFTVGSLGTLAIPTSTTLPTTDLQADGFFGNHKGSLGMFDNGTSTLVLFYRDVDGRWASSAGWTRDILTPT